MDMLEEVKKQKSLINS